MALMKILSLVGRALFGTLRACRNGARHRWRLRRDPACRASAGQSGQLQGLDVDVVLQITAHLTGQDLAAMSMVSTGWRDLIEGHPAFFEEAVKSSIKLYFQPECPSVQEVTSNRRRTATHEWATIYVKLLAARKQFAVLQLETQHLDLVVCMDVRMKMKLLMEHRRNLISDVTLPMLDITCQFFSSLNRVWTDVLAHTTILHAAPRETLAAAAGAAAVACCMAKKDAAKMQTELVQQQLRVFSSARQLIRSVTSSSARAAGFEQAFGTLLDVLEAKMQHIESLVEGAEALLTILVDFLEARADCLTQLAGAVASSLASRPVTVEPGISLEHPQSERQQSVSKRIEEILWVHLHKQGPLTELMDQCNRMLQESIQRRTALVGELEAISAQCADDKNSHEKQLVDRVASLLETQRKSLHRLRQQARWAFLNNSFTCAR